MRPSIFITADPIPGLRSVDDVRRSIHEGHTGRLWEAMRAVADAELSREPYVPTDMYPGRDPASARHANRDYGIVHRAGNRVMRAALACLLTGDRRYRDDAQRQMDAPFDPKRWPEWRDIAHTGMNIDLRAGQLSRSLSLAYDWLCPFLGSSERESIVEGIDRCGIQPFFKDVGAGVRWANGTNNWMTCVVGGHGIAGFALGEDHPRSQDLVDFSLPRMTGYFDNYGPEGEFNESVSYANAHCLPILYFNVWRYASQGAVNRAASFPVPDTCRWLMYFTLPPGRVAPFGDSHLDRRPGAGMFAAVADATRDPACQWFYLQYAAPDDPDTDPWDLLWYDPTLEPALPGMPLGRAYRGHSQNISVRSSWEMTETTCVVYGKGGHGAERHGNHDAGQVCIDGYGERLIVDPGSPPGYPADFFGPNRYEYYNASVFGHNVLQFGDREMRTSEDDCARILASGFDDDRGGWWQLDLTPLYDGVRAVRRTVVYLRPVTILVLDEAQLDAPENISLRWHTVSPCEADEAGRFVTEGDRAAVTARVAALDGNDLTFATRRHAYQPPFDRFRLGDPLEQRHEPYIDVTVTASAFSTASLFYICGPGEKRNRWEGAIGRWNYKGVDRGIAASIDEDVVVLTDGLKTWQVEREKRL